MNSNGGSSFFGSDWLGAFLIIAILFGGGLGLGGNRGPAPNVATQEYVQMAINQQGINNQLQQIALSSANNNYETARLIDAQTNVYLQQNNANQINMLQGFNLLQQQMAQLGYHMDQCCCEIKTQNLQIQYEAALREIQRLQNDKSNSDQTAYLLSVMGKWQANPAAAAA